VSYEARQKAKLNRERRDRQDEREEWLRANANNPVFLEIKAAINGWSWEHGGFKDFLQAHASDPLSPKRRQWGARRGPTFNPARLVRDIKVELLYRSARAAGWSHKASIALGAKELLQPGTGASSPKLVEAIIVKQRLPEGTLLSAAQVEEMARQYGIGTIVSRIKK
jgi:hypothetical protein